MNIMTRLRNDFFTGLAVLLPVAITIFILNIILKGLNKILLEPIIRISKPLIQDPYAILSAKILILLTILVAITLIGVATRIIFLRRFFSFWESILFKLPMVNKIYKGTKQLSQAFLGEGKTIFKKVVLVEYPRRGMYSIAFMTAESKKEIKDRAGRELLNLFLPTTPNPTSGFFIAVPKEDVIFLDMNIEDAFKFIISAGAVQ